MVDANRTEFKRDQREREIENVWMEGFTMEADCEF